MNSLSVSRALCVYIGYGALGRAERFVAGTSLNGMLRGSLIALRMPLRDAE